jgi:hypothetical protein
MTKYTICNEKHVDHMLPHLKCIESCDVGHVEQVIASDKCLLSKERPFGILL